MQSFRERCGFHSNQQNYQPPSQESSRLENYRNQTQPGLTCERQRLLAKEYYNQPSFQGYENSAVDKYHRGNKQLPGQQLQTRPTFPTYAVPENSTYPAQYSGEESLQNWGTAQQPLAGGVAKYEENLMKKAAVPADSRQYQEQTAQLPFQAHPLHLPQQQTTVAYPKLQRQKIQSDVSTFSQTAHFTQHSQSFPPSSTYSPVQGHAVHTYKSCSAPSTQHQERPLASTNMASGQRVQSLHGYQTSRIGYDQQQSLQGRHHSQETLHYQNISKYQHYNQPSQTYCQTDTQVRTPEQYYQTFSPTSSHSPARSVGRSPSYSSTPSPLMPNLENFPYNQQPLNTGAFPAAITDHSHFMPLLNPSPTDTSSPDHPSGNCKNLQKDKLLSDLSLQSLTALTSQVENMNTVQQLLLPKSGLPQKKGIKNPPRTPEQLKAQHCSPENSTYSLDQMGTPLSEPLGTPQSVHNEAQDNEYLSGSEDPLERRFLYGDPNRSPARANHNKMKPESVSTCSVTSPDNMSIKSDDSFQSINATLPLEPFAKYVSHDGECPRLLVNALSQDELSSEIIALQDAINSEKTDKDWETKLRTCNVRSPRPDPGERFQMAEPCMKNSRKENNASNARKDPSKSPFQLENNRTCLDLVVKGAWSTPEDPSALDETLKLGKAPARNHCSDFNEDAFRNAQVEYSAAETKNIHTIASTLAYSSKNSLPAATSSASYSCYSNTTANSVSSKNADTFGWLDKSITESCLRWKELELSLNPSDLENGLFQSKLLGSYKEKKNPCHLSFHDEEPSGGNEPGGELHKEVEAMEEGEEAMSYLESNKADNERWLEDARNCCADEEFTGISIMGSPDLKVSDLEQEEYSPLGDISSPERKSVMDDAASLKSMEKALVASPGEAPGSSVEDMITNEKENVIPSPHLTSHSVLLLGPAIGAESKVKNWFGSSLPHIKDEEETDANVGIYKEAHKADSQTTRAEELNSQIVPESTLKMKVGDLSERKSPHSTRIVSSGLGGDDSGEVLPGRSKNVQVSAAEQSLDSIDQTEIVEESVHVQDPMRNVDETLHMQTPVESVHKTEPIQDHTDVARTAHIQTPAGDVAQTHIPAATGDVFQTVHIQSPTNDVSQSTHIQAPMEGVSQTAHIQAPTEDVSQTAYIKSPRKGVSQTAHIQSPTEGVSQTAHIRTPTEDVSQTTHIQAPTEDVSQTMHIWAPTEHVSQTTHILNPMKGVDQTAHIQAQTEDLSQTIHIQALTEDVSEAAHIQAPTEDVSQTTNIQATIEDVSQTTHIQAPTEDVFQTADIQAPTEDMSQTGHFRAPTEDVSETTHIQAPVEYVSQTAQIQAPVEDGFQTTHIQGPTEDVSQTAYIQAPIEDVSPTPHIRAPLEGVSRTAYIQTPTEDVSQTAHIRTPIEGVSRIAYIQSPTEDVSQTAHNQASMLPSERPPVRMCTRSLTAMSEPRAGGPRQGKLAKRTYGLKQRVAFNAGLRDKKLLPNAVQAAANPDAAPVPIVLPSSDSADKVKEADAQIMPIKIQRSMILRSRTKTQDLFHMKRRREKRATDAGLKNCKATKSSELPSPSVKLAPGSAQVERASKRGKLPKSSMAGKAAECALHALKRKSTLISPIPAKKRNLILRRNKGKQEAPPSLFRKGPLLKTQKAQQLPPAHTSCQVILQNAAAKGASNGCIKITSRAAFQGPLKTKVLPPRKGRGLKLEAIVQKITSPHLKKLACTASAHTDNPHNLAPSDRERASRNASVATAAGEAGRPLNSQDSAHRALAAAQQLCRNSTRPLKGKLANSKRLPSDCWEGEAYSSPEASSSMGIRSMAAQSLSLGPGKRSRKGRPAAAGLGLAQNIQEKPACPSPATRLSPRDKALADKMERPREGRQPRTEDQDFTAEGKLSQARARKRANHSTFNGYSKRQRKGLSPSKAKSKAKIRKSQAQRRQAPIIAPSEPEIKLKYLSCKPMQRVESKARPFAPYVQVERKDAFTTICTVVNTPGDASSFHQEPCSSVTGTPHDSRRAALPRSSVMQLGPVVSKALNVTCLVCCLCRNPSNFRDLGDLCGPYYPEDCLPKKKSRLKAKLIKADELGMGASQSPLAERTPRVTESNCALSAAAGKQPELDGVAADSAKQTLRSSTRGLFRKLQSCYCCDGRAEGEEAEKSRRHQCSKASPVSPSQESTVETQEHWVHEACAIWTRGVYLVGGKLYGLQEATDMAAKVVCPGCQQAGASVSCCHKGCAQTYHFTCANDTGCLLNEDNFSLRCQKHKRQFL